MKTMYFFLIGLLCFYLCGYAGEKRALIVAISQYPKHSEWNTINADNDAEILVASLEKKGFSGKNITLLRDSTATKKNVVAAFKSLQKSVKTGDFVFIHFSCHGQQMEDDNGDEPDGLDEAIVCYDAKMKYSDNYKGQNHLRDDEIDSLLLPIRKKMGESGNLILSMDACHSESSSRGDDGDDVVVRGTAAIFSRPGFKPKKVVGDSKLPLLQEKGLSPITELAACRSGESNYEYKKDDKSYGSLTYSLCKVWDWHNVLPFFQIWSQEIEQEMKNIVPFQTPVFRTTLKEHAGANK